MSEITVALLGRASGDEAASTITSEPGLRLVAIAADPAGLLQRIADTPPDVVVIDAAIAGADGLVPLCADVASRGSVAIVIGGGSDAQLLSRAVMAGARGFVIRPYEPDELIGAIREVGSRRRDGSADEGSRPGGGTILAVYGPKGGAGTTTIATSVAVALAGRADTRVALCDLDLQFGDVGIALDLKSQNNVTDLLAHQGTFDAALVGDVLVPHESGVRALLAPDTLALAGSIEPARVMRAIEQLRGHFDVVVCDLASTYDDLAAAVLDAADAVILVTTPELAALKDLQRVLVASPRLRDARRAQLVVNRWPSRAGVDVAEIERALGRKVAATIPSDGQAVTDALNSGIPAVDARAKVRAAKSYRDLADLVVAGARAAA